jgi:hypothetical protein
MRVCLVYFLRRDSSSSRVTGPIVAEEVFGRLAYDAVFQGVGVGLDVGELGHG